MNISRNVTENPIYRLGRLSALVGKLWKVDPDTNRRISVGHIYKRRIWSKMRNIMKEYVLNFTKAQFAIFKITKMEVSMEGKITNHGAWIWWRINNSQIVH